MISFTEAVEKANAYLEDTENPVVITLQGRFSEGCFFCFESKAFLETGDFSTQLAGNAPFIIDKDSGELHVFGTAFPLEKYLQDYEEDKNC